MKESDILSYIQQSDKPLSRDIFNAGFHTGRKHLQEDAAQTVTETNPFLIAADMITAIDETALQMRVERRLGESRAPIIGSELAGVVINAMKICQMNGIDLGQAVEDRMAQSREQSGNQAHPQPPKKSHL